MNRTVHWFICMLCGFILVSGMLPMGLLAMVLHVSSPLMSWLCIVVMMGLGVAGIGAVRLAEQYA